MGLEVDNNFKNKVINSIQTLLNQEFTSGEKTVIDGMYSRLNFACPYCGDSSENHRKKRGNLFWDSLYYHCYNAGCNKHKSLNELLKDFGLRQSLDSKSRLDVLEYIKQNNQSYEKLSVHEFNMFKDLNSLGVSLDYFYKMTNSKPISSGIGFSILKDRLLTHRSDEFAIGYNKLYVLNLSAERKVIGYQIRYLKYADSKYITYNINKLRTSLKLKGIKEELDCTDEYADKINKLSTLFHILNINFSNTLTIFEGPIDAKFMRNSIGLSSVGKDLTMFKEIPNIRFFFDNDKAGKDEMRKLLREGFTVFLWKKFIDDNKIDYYNIDDDPIKDLNDIIKFCFKHKLKFFQNIDKYFSNNKIDMYYI